MEITVIKIYGIGLLITRNLEFIFLKEASELEKVLKYLKNKFGIMLDPFQQQKYRF